MAIKDKLNEIKRYYDNERGDREKYLWDYYIGRDVPVFKRKPVSDMKASTHTNTHEDFMKDIIDLKTGYMGQKIDVSYTGDSDIIKQKLQEFDIWNNMTINNSDTVRKTAISGISHRLLYTQKGIGVGDGKLKIKNIGPEVGTVVYDYTNSIYDADKAFFYYVTVDIDGTKRYHCDIYTKTNVTYYRDDNQSKDQADGYLGVNTKNFTYQGRTYIRKGSERHNFNQVPLIPFINNDTWTGDCDKVIGRKEDSLSDGLMDVYDEILSDTSAEVKAMRMAYLKIFGQIYTGKDSDGKAIDINTWMKQTSSMRFSIDEDGNRIGDAEFLEKNIQDGVIENLLNRLRTGIYEKSGSVDVKAISEGNNQRVISIKAQLMRLENNVATTESYMKAGFNKMIELFVYWLDEYHNIKASSLDFVYNFERVFPTDVETLATVTKLYTEAGVSLKDALRLTGHDDYEVIEPGTNQ